MKRNALFVQEDILESNRYIDHCRKELDEIRHRIWQLEANAQWWLNRINHEKREIYGFETELKGMTDD